MKPDGMVRMRMNVIYLRVSSEEQREKQTIKGQGEAVERHCHQNNVAIGKIYSDDGVSGTDPLPQRPAGSELLRDVRNGLIGTIYIWKIDRLARDLRLFLNLLHAFDRHEVKVVIVTEPVADRFSMHIYAAMAQKEREKILENCMRGQKSKAERGLFHGGLATFGYKVEGEGPTAHEVPNDDMRDVILKAFVMYDENKSPMDIADWIAEQGVPTARGGLWRSSNVLKILRDTAYIGRKKWNKRQGIRIEDEWGVVTKHVKRTPEREIEIPVPPIVPQDLFDRVQAKLTANQTAKKAGVKEEYLLRRLIFCGTCGRRYTGAGRYYTCMCRARWRQIFGKNGKPCPSPNHRRDHMDACVWFWCEQYIENPDQLALDIAEQRMKNDADRTRAASEITKLESALAKQNKLRQRAQDLLMDETFTKAEYDRQIQKIEAATEPIQRKLERLREERRSAEESAEGIKHARAILESLWAKKYSFAEKRRIVEALIDRITVEPLPDEYVEGWSREECYRIDFKFNWAPPRWETRGHQFDGATQAQAEAGAAALLIASEQLRATA